MNEENPKVSEATRNIGRGLSQLGKALDTQRENVAEPMSKFILERPIAAVGIAMGIGYVLGGGLFSRTTSRLLGMGWRVGGMALARNFLQGLAAQAGERL